MQSSVVEAVAAAGVVEAEPAEATAPVVGTQSVVAAAGGVDAGAAAAEMAVAVAAVVGGAVVQVVVVETSGVDGDGPPERLHLDRGVGGPHRGGARSLGRIRHSGIPF